MMQRTKVGSDAMCASVSSVSLQLFQHPFRELTKAAALLLNFREPYMITIANEIPHRLAHRPYWPSFHSPLLWNDA